MADLPDPLVPADVDLRGFSGFMLDVDRLLASELVALGTPDECWAAFMLWCRAWKQSPPGTLPNNERILAAFSGAGTRWPKVREMALRGFVLCADGRFHHPVLAEQAMAAWGKRKAYRNDQERLKKWRASKRSDAPGNADETRFTDVSDDVSLGVSEPDRQGQGQGQGLNSSNQSDDQTEEPKRRASKPRSQVPADWEPNHDGHVYAEQRGVTVPHELAAFRNHHQAKGSLMADWSAAWRTWCDNQVKFGRAPGKRPDGAPSLFAAQPAAPDPQGIGAWMERQETTMSADPKTGKSRASLHGYFVEHVADLIADAAGLPETWRGKWDALAGWMRDDIEMSPHVLAAISDQARRMRDQGNTIGAIAVFDAAVRAAARKAA